MDEKHIGPNINIIPDRGLSKLACTLVAKQWCCVCHILGSNAAANNVKELQHGLGHKGELFFPIFFAVRCFDFVPFPGDPQEHRGYVAILPTFGPPRGQGLCSHRERHPEKGHGLTYPPPPLVIATPLSKLQ